MFVLECQECKKPYTVKSSYYIGRSKYCSRRCTAVVTQRLHPELRKKLAHRGESHYRWHGGKAADRYGYILKWCPGYPKANSKGYYAEHRYVMEQYLGRLLDSSELVHHINGDKTDNRIENLMLISRSEHIKIHPPGRRR